MKVDYKKRQIDQEIRKKYVDNFDRIEVSDDFKEKMKKGVRVKCDEKYHKRTVYKTAIAIAACFIMVVFIVNGNRITAAVNNIYEMFVGKVDSQFENNASGYEIDINKKFNVNEKIDIKIDKMVVLNNSVDMKYSISDNQADISISECVLKAGKKIYILNQDMIEGTRDSFLISMASQYEKYDLTECKDTAVDVELTVYYGRWAKEKKFQFSVDVKDVYQTRTYDLSHEKISVGGWNIDSIQKGLWYMKVVYSSDDISMFYDEKASFSSLIFENKEDLLWLGQDKELIYEEDGKIPKKVVGTEYVQLDENVDKFNVYYATFKTGKIEKDEMFYDKSDDYVTIDLSKYEKSN